MVGRRIVRGKQIVCGGEWRIKVVRGINRWRQIPDSDSGSYFKRIRHLGFIYDTFCTLRLKVSYGIAVGTKRM